MARAKKKDDDHGGSVNGELPKPDFERAIRVMRSDLNPLIEESAEIRGNQAAGWKTIEKDCHCNKKAAKQFHSIMRMDPELRDDFFRTFQGLLAASGIGISPDLFDQAEGNEPGPIIPVVDRARPQLATVN